MEKQTNNLGNAKTYKDVAIVSEVPVRVRGGRR